MKHFILLNLLAFFTVTGDAQVTPEQRYDYSTSSVKFETLGYKYYLMDVPNAQCRIYNNDHSLFKTILCNVPSGSYLCDVSLLSQKLFDADEGIELSVTWYTYIPTTDSYYYEYGSSIINEDGTSLATIEGARYLYLKETDENTWKLFAYCYDYSTWPERVWTNIYSLPGAPVSVLFLESGGQKTDVKAYPNPAMSTVKVSYSLPSGVNKGVLYLTDNNGKQVSRFEVDNHIDHLLLDVSVYPPGVYHYFVSYGGKRTSSKKLLIQ